MFKVTHLVLFLLIFLVSDIACAVLPTGAWSQRVSLKVKQIASGGYHTCALLENSRVKCWGLNGNGNLGLGHLNNLGDGSREMGEALPYVDLGTNRLANEIAAGVDFTCALLDNGSMKCWGINGYGQLGQGHNNNIGDDPGEMGDSLSAINVGTNRSVLKMAVGQYGVCVLLDDSSVKCWGGNTGQLGLGHASFNLGDDAGEMGDALPVVSLGTGRKVVEIFPLKNSSNFCARLDDGSLKCWGNNTYGQLGLGDTNTRGDSAGEMGDSLPVVNLGTGLSALQLSGTYGGMCAVLNNSQLKCWGSNGGSGLLGQGHNLNLGDGAGEMGDTLAYTDLGSGLKVLSVTSGGWYTCALLNNHKVKCWGLNNRGQLGYGNTTGLGYDPSHMGDNLSFVDVGTNRFVKQLDGGYEHVCALLDDGSVKCWGRNQYGQLGVGSTQSKGDGPGEMGNNLAIVNFGSKSNRLLTTRASTLSNSNLIPLSNSNNSSHSCILLVNGQVKCWGDNSNGLLGLGDTDRRGDGPDEMGDNLPTVNLGTGRSATQLAMGMTHNCVLLDNSQVKCWGDNSVGQLGLGDTSARGDAPNEMGDSLPVVNLGTGRYAKQIVAGGMHTCALLDNSQVKCWGYNNFGNLGLGDTSARGDAVNEMGDSLPFVDLGTGRSAVSIVSGNHHVCVLLDNSKVKCWGFNNNGQLGLGNMLHRGDAANEMGDNLPEIDLGTGRIAIQIVAGLIHNCVLLDNSQVKCWGYNSSGELGLGDVTRRGSLANQMGDNLPAIDLGTGRTAMSVFAGGSNSCVILDNSQLKCWGSNTGGKLGLGDTTARGDGASEMGDSLPTIDLGTSRKARVVQIGESHICAILDNSQLKCWGAGLYGRLGSGSTANLGDGPNEMGDNLPEVNLGTGK